MIVGACSIMNPARLERQDHGDVDHRHRLSTAQGQLVEGAARSVNRRREGDVDQQLVVPHNVSAHAGVEIAQLDHALTL
jgi:hypothetical protein